METQQGGDFCTERDEKKLRRRHTITGCDGRADHVFKLLFLMLIGINSSAF